MAAKWNFGQVFFISLFFAVSSTSDCLIFRILLRIFAVVVFFWFILRCAAPLYNILLLVDGQYAATAGVYQKMNARPLNSTSSFFGRNDLVDGPRNKGHMANGDVVMGRGQRRRGSMTGCHMEMGWLEAVSFCSNG